MQIQAILPQLPIETLDQSILSGLAGLNDIEFDAGTYSSEEHCLSGHRWPGSIRMPA